MAAKKFFLIDGMALAFRSFFAFPRPLYRADGLPTAAIYGTAVFLHKLIYEEQPDFIVCALDSDAPTFRHEMYQAYKGTRSAMPDDLSRQMDSIYELYEKMGCHVVRTDGYEADDIIATLARRFANPERHAFIVSGDKDFMQLVNEFTFLYIPKKNEDAQICDANAVRDKFNCSPDRVVDALALIGDAVDNVPGVPGIGEKTAAALIGSYGSLDGIYSNIDDIKAKKQKENLLAHKDAAYLSQKLVTLRIDVPTSIQLEDLKIDPDQALNDPALLQFFEVMEFKNLLQRKGVQGSGIQKGAAKQPETTRAIHVEDKLSPDLVKKWCAAKIGGFALPWEGLDLICQGVERIALAVDDAVHVVTYEKSQHALWNQIFSASCLKVCHSLKEQFHILQNMGIDTDGPFFCVKIADYLIDPNRDNHSLDACAPRYAGILRKEISAEESQHSALQQLGRDAHVCLELHASIHHKIEELGLTKVLHDIEFPLAKVLARVEHRGMKLDGSQLNELSDYLEKRLSDIVSEVHKEVGYAFNLGSPKQLQKVLFEDLCLQEKLDVKRIKKTKTGFSTDESVLTSLSEHLVPRLILEHRGLSVLKNTFVDALPTFIHPKTGRVHTKLHQTVAATGRLSSDSPNLQNIPMRSELGRQVRKAFVPSAPDEVMIAADYSQVEIRLLAHLSQEEILIKGFEQRLDIHALTASKIFNVPLEAMTRELRDRAKAINFGIIYGMGPQRLAAETGVSMTDAKTFIEKYFIAYPNIRRYTQSLIQNARNTGYTISMTGRRRPIPGIHDANRAIVARAENIAINAPIQGSAADLIKLAMIHIEKAVVTENVRCKMLLQIHDELVFSCHNDDLTKAKDLIKYHMETAFQVSVPLEVLISSGKNWLEAH